MEAKETFAQRFTELCAGRTQKEIADALKVTRASIGYYQNGDRSPDITMLSKIAELFGVSSDYLIGLSDAKHPENDDIISRSGLSEKSIERICGIYERDSSLIEVLNQSIRAINFEYLLMNMREYIRFGENQIISSCSLPEEDLKEVQEHLGKYGYTAISSGEKRDYLEFVAQTLFTALLREINLPHIELALEKRVNNNGDD